MIPRLCLIALAAASCAASAAHAAPMNSAPGGKGSGAWAMPYAGVSRGMMTQLQEFMRADMGPLVATEDQLRTLLLLQPDVAAHRAIVGALAFAPEFEDQLEDALQSSDKRRRAQAARTIMSAYYGQNAGEKIDAAVSARADELVAAVRERRITADELAAASAELEPFWTISDKAAAVGGMARAARSEKTMEAARRIAASLVVDPLPIAPPTDAEAGALHGVGDVGQKILSAQARLQPHAKAAPTSSALEAFAGTYAGMFLADAATVSEIEIVVSNNGLRLRQATRDGAREESIAASDLKPMQASELPFAPGSKLIARSNGFAVEGGVKLVFVSNPNDDDPSLMTIGKIGGFFGTTILFGPSQIERGDYAAFIRDVEQRQGKNRLLLLKDAAQRSSAAKESADERGRKPRLASKIFYGALLAAAFIAAVAVGMPLVMPYNLLVLTGATLLMMFLLYKIMVLF